MTTETDQTEEKITGEPGFESRMLFEMTQTVLAGILRNPQYWEEKLKEQSLRYKRPNNPAQKIDVMPMNSGLVTLAVEMATELYGKIAEDRFDLPQ